MKPTQVLQTKHLNVKDVLLFARRHIEIQDYLPEYKRGRFLTEYGLLMLGNLDQIYYLSKHLIE